MTDINALLATTGLTTVQLSQLLSAALPSVHRWRHGQAAPSGLAKLFLGLLADLTDRHDGAQLGARIADTLQLRGCPAALRLILDISLEETDEHSDHRDPIL